MNQIIRKLKDKCCCCGEQLRVRATFFEKTSLHHVVDFIGATINQNPKTDYRLYLLGTYIKLMDKEKLYFYATCSTCQKKHNSDIDKMKNIIISNLKNGMKINIYKQDDKELKTVSCKRI